MLPVGLVRGVLGQQVTVELKNGQRCTGTLMGVDPWMNVNLDSVQVDWTRSALLLPRVDATAYYPALHIRGTMIRLLVLPNKAWDLARDERLPRSASDE
jgi:small nuclear ribonucleoprotein (snRNP)-like protein